MIQLALYFNIIGSNGVAMIMQNYIQSASLKRFLMRWKQNIRQQAITPACWSLCVLPSIPCHQFKVHSSEIFTIRISCIFIVHTRCKRYSYCICTPWSWWFSASIPSLLLLHSSCYCSQSRIQGQVVQISKAPFPTRPYCHHHINHVKAIAAVRKL